MFIDEFKSRRIQILRGLSILAVVLIHTCPSGVNQTIFRPFINFSVATFIFLSGILTVVGGGIRGNRIRKVLLPYILWSILYTTASKSPEKLIFNLLMTKANGPFYYIFVYIELVLLTPLIEKLANSKYKIVGFIISPLSLLIYKYVLFSLTFYAVDTEWFSILWGISCLMWFDFFYLGFLLRNGFMQINKSKRKIGFLYVVSLMIQIAEGYVWYALGDSNCGTQGKLSSMLSSFIFCSIAYQFIQEDTFFEGSKKIERLFILLGNYSFGIYLSHNMVINVLYHILPFYNRIPYGLNSMIVLLISLFCVAVGKKILGNYAYLFGLQ